MDLELPVDGSLDDPDFHYGKVVWKAIVNVLGKLVSATVQREPLYDPTNARLRT